jgi:hypothetical protein
VDDPEDKGPRYRLVMFVALAAIVVPGFFLLSWIGDNGVNNLFRDLLGFGEPQARATRTVGLQSTPTAQAAVVISPTATAMTSGEATPSAVPATATQSPPATATAQPAATATAPPIATPTPPPATATPPPAPTATPAVAPTSTPPANILGYGTAIPAYGGAAVIRSEPETDSDAIGSIPVGERVMVYAIVQGEAIDPVESRWWDVEYEGVRGFVYYKLIALD